MRSVVWRERECLEFGVSERSVMAAEEVTGSTDECKELLYINAGGWIFPIPKNKLSSFHDSLLYREFSLLPESERTRLFLDRDGFVFSHIHQFLLVSQLPIPSLSELDLLYEQAREFNLMGVIEQEIDQLKSGKEEKRTLHEQMGTDSPISKKAPMIYWQTHKYNSRLSEWPPKMPLAPGTQDQAHLGLLVDPLIDAEEEVHYCFFPIDILEKYPLLVTDDNLLWYSEKFILLECGSPAFRYIGNFLHYGNFFLPSNFSAIEGLEAEIHSLGIPELLKALYEEKNSSGDVGQYMDMSHSLTENKMEQSNGGKPFYMMSLDLLGKYPDSALGQLYIKSSVGGSKLYISGTGAIFQHVKNWLGACRLPLTRNALEIHDLHMYLDKGDLIYQPMREAFRTYLNNRLNRSPGALCENWEADVQQYSATQIVKVYVRSHWYATHLKTLLQYPELLANFKKTRWITCGFSLLVIGDGSIFRHILNFLRLGRLLLPSDFTEWRLLCQEVNEFQISALKDALSHCPEYRLWLREHGSTECSLDSKHENMRFEQRLPIHGLKDNRIMKEKASCVKSAKGLTSVPWKKEPSTSRLTPSQTKNPDRYPSAKYLKLDQTTEGEKAKVTTSPMLRFISFVEKLPDDSGVIGSVRDQLQGRGLLTTSPAQGESSTARSQKHVVVKKMKQHKLQKKFALSPIIHKNKSSVQNTKNKENVMWPLHRSASLLPFPVHKDKIQLKITSCKDNIKVNDGLEEHLGHTRLPPSLWFIGQTREKDRTTSIEHAYCARNQLEGIQLADLGAILWVHHQHLVAIDGSTASFQDLIMYTPEQDIKELSHHGTTSDDLVFLSVNMSHDKVFYASKCHSFLTGVIMDSIEQKDPKSTIFCVAGLVSMLWADQIPVRQFVEYLLTLEMYRDGESTKETLLRWLQLTLPYAKKLSQCINVMLQKRCHKSSLCLNIRQFLS